MTESTPLLDSTDDELTRVEFEKFKLAIGEETDPTMLVLRGHLFSENLLERLIRLKLPRGDIVVDAASFSYAQKLLIVEAVEVVPDSIAASLRALNKLRNQCAHDLGRAVMDTDVVRIGSPLGKRFTAFHRGNKYDPISTLRSVVDYVVGYITGVCHGEEEVQVVEQEAKDKRAVPTKSEPPKPGKSRAPKDAYPVVRADSQGLVSPGPGPHFILGLPYPAATCGSTSTLAGRDRWISTGIRF